MGRSTKYTNVQTGRVTVNPNSGLAIKTSKVYRPNTASLYYSVNHYCPPLDQPQDIDSLMIENEMLREELCENQNNVINHVYSQITYDHSKSKADVKREIASIIAQTGGVLTESQIWKLIVGSIISEHDLAEIMEPNESLIDVMWRLELLPYVSVYISVFRCITNSMEYYSRTTLANVLKGISKGMKNKLGQSLTFP